MQLTGLQNGRQAQTLHFLRMCLGASPRYAPLRARALPALADDADELPSFLLEHL